MKARTVIKKFLKRRYSRKCTKLYKHILKITSAILLPLLLAIFTVVITFEQRKENDQQRFEDRELARVHREQDLNMSILTREADKYAAQLQRENDRDIANNQRNMSQILENHQYKQEREKYFDSLLANYLNEIGQLLKENNGSLTINSGIAALSRSKTLHILRIGIGPIRAGQIIQYLYDAEQLNASNNPLDLSYAPLNGINFNGLPMRSLYLVRTRLSNASFTNLDISYGNFSGAYMIGTNFSWADCSNTDFTGTNLFKTDFSNAILTNATFTKTKLSRSTFINANISYATFRSADLSYTNLSHTNCTDTIFYKTKMISSDLSYAILVRTKFYQTNLTETTFSNATSNGYWIGYRCLFDSVQLKKANFTNTNLNYVVFIKCNMIGSIFRRAQILIASIISSNATHSDFTDANLYGSTVNASALTFASFVNADITRTIFRYNDLSNANLSKAKCDNDICSWNEALSVYNATLPNGSIGPLNNLISKSHVQCNLSIEEHGWIVNEKDSILIEHISDNSEECVFIRSPNYTRASMTLSVNLSRFTGLIESGQAIALFRAHRSGPLDIEIQTEQSKDTSSSLLAPTLFYSDQRSQGAIGRLYNNTKNLKIRVAFYMPPYERDIIWLGYIELRIGLYLGCPWYYRDCRDKEIFT
jgi:uncharacterized protein YjbI with pentapeptide repeats